MGILDGFLSVMSFMTRLPVPGSRHGAPGAAVWAFPFAGLVVGAIGALVLWIAREIGLGAWAAAFLALGATAFVTGALHEDGLADSFDGLWAGGDVERRLTIMRDSRIGGYGALALIIATGLKASLLAAIADPISAASALIAAHMLGRSVPALLMGTLDSASKSGLAAAAGRPHIAHVGIAFLIAALAAMLLLGTAGLIAVVLTLLAAFAAYRLLKRKLGGHNGDTLGAAEQFGELACLIAATALAAHS